MDGYENLVCKHCGMPLNDAILAGCGSSLCCSALWSNVPGMVCPISERPLFCFKNHFNPGGNFLMNPIYKCNKKEVNSSTGMFLAPGYGSKHLERHDRIKVESSSGQVGACSQGIDCDELQGNIKVCSNGNLKGDVKVLDPNDFDAPDEKKSEFGLTEKHDVEFTPLLIDQDPENEAEGHSIPEDSNGAQTPSSSNEGREVSGQANDCLRKVNRALFQSQPSNDTQRSDNLKLLGHILSSSRVDGNRNVQKQSAKADVEIISSEKDSAPGTSSRTPDMNFAYIKKVESRLADLEKIARDSQKLEKVVAQHDLLLREDRCYRHYLEIHVSQQRDAIRQLQDEFNALKLNYELLHGKYVQAQVKIVRLQESGHQVRRELSALHQKADFNKQRIEGLVRSLDNMNEKVDAYVSLLCRVDIQSVA